MDGPSQRQFSCFSVVSLIGGCCVVLAAPGIHPAQVVNTGDPAPPSVQRLDLDSCIAIALKNQPAVGAQRSAMCAAAQRQKIARSFFLPQVSFDARYTHLDQPRTVDLPNPFAGRVGDVFSDAAAYFGIARQAGTAVANAALDSPNLPPFSIAKQMALDALPDRFSVGLLGENSLTTEFLLLQPLWTGGKISYRHQQAQLGVQAASADLLKSQQQTVFDVTQAYLAVQLAHELTRVLDDAAGHFRAIQRLVKALIDEGDEYVTTVDLHRACAVRLLAESEKTGAERAADLAHEALRQAMGLEPRAEFEIADRQLIVHQRRVELPAILDAAMIQRPELAKARLAVEITELQRKLARANYLPDVGLFARFGTIDDDGGFPNPNDRQEWAVGVTLGVPIYTGGRRSAQQAQASFQEAQARQVHQLARQLVTLEVQKAYLEYLEMSKRLPVAEAAVQETTAALEAYRSLRPDVEPKAMPDYYKDLVNAWVLHSLARTSYYKTVFQYDLSLAKIRLVTASHEYQNLFDDSQPGTTLVADDGGAGPPGDGGKASTTGAAQNPPVFQRCTRRQR
jgi:outer membrane protein TolC